MPHIDSTKFGSVIVDGKVYHQVLISGDQVSERDVERLNRTYGDTHAVGDWELDQLLATKPEIIIIGTGTIGVLKVDQKTKQKIEKAGVKLIALFTPIAVKEYNKLAEEGKRVCALIHTTC